MTPEQITAMVNGLTKTIRKFVNSVNQVDKLKVGLVRNDEDGYWDLVIRENFDSKDQTVKLVLDLPENLSPDNTEALIQIAGTVSQRLSSYFRGVKANASRSKESKSASAKKAVQARWSSNIK